MTNVNKPIFRMRDLWGAAFLMVYGFGEPTLVPSSERPGLLEFCFEETPGIRACYAQYREGEDIVGAKAYRSAVRTLKRLLAEHFHTFEDPGDGA